MQRSGIQTLAQPPANPPPTVLVLAGGSGSRFGGATHKLMQPLGGSTVLGQTVLHAMRSGLPVVVVTTDDLAAECARWVARSDLVIVPRADGAPRTGPGEPLGMGYSIAAGVSACPHGGGWLVLPADMPLVRPETLQAVAQGLKDHLAVFAQHLGRRGHPVAFAPELFSDLVLLSGDEGARRVLARYPAHGVELPDPGVLIDIDTAEDLQRAQRELQQA